MDLDLSINELLNILNWYKKNKILNKKRVDDVNEDMNYEIFMLEQIAKHLNLPIEDFFYCGDNRIEVLTHFWKLCQLRNIVPSYLSALKWQKLGADYIINGVLLDLKVVGKYGGNYGNRASFNLIKDKESGLWKFENEIGSRVIAPYIISTSTQYMFPTMLITDIVNKHIDGLNFDVSIYNNKSLFRHDISNGRDLFNIDCECIQKYVQIYLNKSKYPYVSMLLNNYKPIKINKTELQKYLQKIKV